MIRSPLEHRRVFGSCLSGCSRSAATSLASAAKQCDFTRAAHINRATSLTFKMVHQGGATSRTSRALANVIPKRRLIQSLFILAPSTMCIILTPSAPGFPVGGCTGKSRSAPGNPGQLRGIPVSSGKSRWDAAQTALPADARKARPAKCTDRSLTWMCHRCARGPCPPKHFWCAACSGQLVGR